MERVPGAMGGEIKKGPWTSEEDLILSSYVRENGPGNWTSIPTITGLNRCGKSCRLRWMNYLRPGIKRGKFTSEEDRKIVQLQAVMGNKWSGIAHYLPGRTDNDIKNYWNSNLKKEVDRARGSRSDDDQHHAGSSVDTTTSVLDQDSDSDTSKRRWERMLRGNVHLARKALSDALSFPPQAAIPDHDDVSLSPPDSAASLPPITPGPSSAAPQLSSGCLSFKPPRSWNQKTSHQQLMISFPPQATIPNHDDVSLSPPDSAASLPPIAPGPSSPLPMAAPQLSSGCMSFKPPHSWNQKTSHQQLMISLPPQAAIPDLDDVSLSPPDSAASLPPIAPGPSSPLPMAVPQLSSGCMSFKPPRSWNQKTSHQQLMISLPPQAAIPDHDDVSLSPPDYAAILPPIATGLSSPLPMAAPLLSSGCTSFKPPHGWNQETSRQQLNVPADNHQLHSQAAPRINWASNCSTTTEPYVFNCENVAQWLLNWNKETSKEIKSADNPPLPPATVTPPASLEGQQYDPPPATFAATDSLGGQNEDDHLAQLNMSLPCDEADWPFF